MQLPTHQWWHTAARERGLGQIGCPLNGMTTVANRALIATVGLFAGTLLVAPPATAQFFAQPSDFPIGENYQVEALGGMWSPTPDFIVASDAFGIPGTNIDFVSDLGISAQRFGEFRLRLRPGRRHRFRIDYLPIRYTAQNVVERRLVFRGIAYDVGVPVDSSVTWRTWRLGYEFDVIHQPRGYFGLLVEAKYTELEARLDTAVNREFTRARGPIPAVGAVVKMYPLQVLGLAAEVSFFRLPNNVVNNYSGEYVDVDVYATFNFTQEFGAQIGYRSLNLNVQANEDLADLRLDGIYLGALVRF